MDKNWKIPPLRTSQRGRPVLLNRRDFLGMGAVATLGMFGQRLALALPGDALPQSRGYGPLQPALDHATGLPLIDLPEGFSYRSFGWTGEAMTGDVPTPARHDGMAVALEKDGALILLRNHEIWTESRSFAPSGLTYDRWAGGGVTRIRFDAEQGTWLDAQAALGGTMTNCAGGATPWGSWLSCEEDLSSPGQGSKLRRDHGYVFEVDALDQTSARPIKEMGRFLHEACAVDPESGIVYMTEDNDTSGFYRYLPSKSGQLRDGGELQMLKVRGRDSLRTEELAPGSRLETEWVTIRKPDSAHQRGTRNGMGVFMQGYRQGGAVFKRGEGCIVANGKIVFACTTGGRSGLGQIWALDPREQILELLLESPGPDQLNHPDNLAVSPRGGLVICEDGGRLEQQLVGMSPEGELFAFARNKVVLNGEIPVPRGDYRASEWAGACFFGNWLFVNIQVPGVTLAITGPWEEGPL
jgi:secreted PhoX family phosphatase